MDKIRIPYDKLWKDVVGENISDFLAMFLPALHKLVDYTVKIEFLEQELKSALKDKTHKLADKLIKLQLKNGKEKWVYVHVEFETRPRKAIGERMFGYFHRIRDTYGKDVTAIVIYTGSDVPTVYDKYEYRSFGTKLTYHFNAYQVRAQKEEKLRNNPNPFAVIVLANLYVLQTKDDPEKRLSLKEHIYEIARKRNYSEEKIGSLLTFITELMVLPKELKEKFIQFVYKSRKPTNMAHLSDQSLSLADAIAKREYGKTLSEMNTGISNALAQLKQERALQKQEREKSIVLLYTKAQMPIEEIAKDLGLDIEVVRAVIKKQKRIKK